MGYGAIISALVNTGFQIYGQLSKPDPAAIAGQMGGELKSLADKILKPTFTQPSYWDINVPQLASQGINFGLANAPAINAANMGQLQGLLGQALPGYQGAVNQSMANIKQQLAGNLPADVINQIQRSSAYGALRGGFAGTGAAQALTARDLGLTSLQMQQQGQAGLEQMVPLASKYLMPQPVNPMSLLPLSDLISTTQWGKTNYYAAMKNYYQARANAVSAQFGGTPSSTGGLGSDVTSLLTALNQKPTSGGGQSIMGMLGGLFGGGGGSNTNPNFNLGAADVSAQEQGFSSYAAGEAAGYI